MFKKIILCAMALGALTAFVLPTSASATWKHHQDSIQQDVQFGITGNVRFDTGNGGAECQFTARVKFFAGQTTGSVETFTPHPTNETVNCKGLGGYAFCQIHDMTPQAPNWTLHTSQAETTQVTVHGGGENEVTVKGTGVSHQAILITTQALTAQSTGSFCPGKHINMTPGTVAAVPNQPNTFSSLQLNGIVKAHKQLNNGQVNQENTIISGLLQVESPNAGTYSL